MATDIPALAGWTAMLGLVSIPEVSPVKRTLVLAGMMAVAATAAAQEPPAAPPAPQPEVQQWTGPEVTLQTTMGDIVIVLDTVGAPKTAAQFLGLVKGGHYDGASFYRVEPGFLIQLGDLDAKLQYRQPKLPPVPLETATNKHSLGAVGMAHGDDPDSGQSTFYIDLADNVGLGATPDAAPNTTGYAAFGHVTSGMDVATAISGVELAPEGGPFPGKLPRTPVVVKKAVVTKE
jgi:cyclophilin family peptidyl-prolyl cis-trans isomerase